MLVVVMELMVSVVDIKGKFYLQKVESASIKHIR